MPDASRCPPTSSIPSQGKVVLELIRGPEVGVPDGDIPFRERSREVERLRRANSSRGLVVDLHARQVGLQSHGDVHPVEDLLHLQIVALWGALDRMGDSKRSPVGCAIPIVPQRSRRVPVVVHCSVLRAVHDPRYEVRVLRHRHRGGLEPVPQAADEPGPRVDGDVKRWVVLVRVHDAQEDHLSEGVGHP